MTEQEARAALAEVKATIELLGLPMCSDLGEMVELIAVAVGEPAKNIPGNDAQLRILMQVMSRPEPVQKQAPGAARWNSSGRGG